MVELSVNFTALTDNLVSSNKEVSTPLNVTKVGDSFVIAAVVPPSQRQKQCDCTFNGIDSSSIKSDSSVILILLKAGYGIIFEA